MEFFTNLPNIYYKLNSTEYKLAKNLFRRLRIRGSNNAFAIATQPYVVQPFENIEEVAFKFYGDPAYWWVIAIANNIISIRDEWYATQEEIENLYTNPDYISYYETIEIKDSAGFVRIPSGIVVPSNYSFSYKDGNDTVSLSGNSLVVGISYNFDIFRKNEAKRNVNILLPQYLPLVKAELETLLQYNTSFGVIDGVKLTG